MDHLDEKSLLMYDTPKEQDFLMEHDQVDVGSVSI